MQDKNDDWRDAVFSSLEWDAVIDDALGVHYPCKTQKGSQPLLEHERYYDITLL